SSSFSFLIIRPTLLSTLFPYTTLFRSSLSTEEYIRNINNNNMKFQNFAIETEEMGFIGTTNLVDIDWKNRTAFNGIMLGDKDSRDRKSTRLNSSHVSISYAVFCLKKKK